MLSSRAQLGFIVGFVLTGLLITLHSQDLLVDFLQDGNYTALEEDNVPTTTTDGPAASPAHIKEPVGGEVDVNKFVYKKEGPSDEDLRELKKKVKIIVTTVEQNRDRIKLLREVNEGDEWAQDLFIFISDVSHPEDDDFVTYPECEREHVFFTSGSWIPKKCCRFRKWYFETWQKDYPEVEWVFKADDDTFVHPRNLLLAIASIGGSSHNNTVAHTQPLFMGHRSHDDPNYDAMPLMWMHGGGGWLINWATRDFLHEQKPFLQCTTHDDVDWGNWVQSRGVRNTPYGGICSWPPFHKKQSKGRIESFNLEPAAFFLCVKEEVIKMPYYPVTFHKTMISFLQVAKVMRRKRFELIDLPPLRPEYKKHEGKSDNYYRRLLPWLKDQANPATSNYSVVDCSSVFNWDQMREVANRLQLLERSK